MKNLFEKYGMDLGSIAGELAELQSKAPKREEIPF